MCRSVGIERFGSPGDRGVELEDRFRRLLLVPQRHRQDAAICQRPHVVEHGLACVGVLFNDGEAAGVGEPDGVGQAQIDHVVAVGRAREIEASILVDHAESRIVEDIRRGLLEAWIAEGSEDRRIALGNGHRLRPGVERHHGRYAAAELHDERGRVLLQHIGVVGWKVAVIGGVRGRQLAHDAFRAFAIDVHGDVDIGRDLGNVEGGVVRQARREVHVGASVDLQVTERRDAAVDALRIREIAGVGDALVLGDGDGRDAEKTGQR